MKLINIFAIPFLVFLYIHFNKRAINLTVLHTPTRVCLNKWEELTEQDRAMNHVSVYPLKFPFPSKLERQTENGKVLSVIL